MTEADVALGRVLPGISFVGSYDRNQYTSEINLGALGGANQTIVLLPGLAEEHYRAGTAAVLEVDRAPDVVCP
jgi:hypothetical protein